MTGSRPRRTLWWRWSWRDLRDHWVAVLSIGLVIAIGTGVYAGLGSTAVWRRASNDASFAELRLHDLRVELSPGTFVTAGELTSIAGRIPSAADISATDERLVVDTQVDASTADQTILVSGRIVGAAYGRPAAVDDLWVAEGDLPAEPTAGGGVVVEMKFADHYALAAEGTLRITGDRSVPYVGLGVGPEEFYVTGTEGSILAHADHVTLYAATAVAQELAGRPGMVNDLVVLLAPGADRALVAAELEAAFDEASGIGATVSTRDDVDAYSVLYEDIENDQQIWNLLSALVLVAAAMAAFNLISRIVEAQRREIGIGMALGTPRWRLGIRPVLVAAQVGAIGTLAGIGVGVLIGRLMRNLMVDLLPMPQWLTSFQADIYLRGAVIGFVPPIVAAVIPVWRAVRVEPIEAIRTGHLAKSSGRLGAWTRSVRLPGSALAQMPVRNLLRAPRRTMLTALGVGAAVTALVAVLALLDSFGGAIDRGAAEVTRGDPERVTVVLDTYYPIDAPVVAALADAPEVGAVDTSLRVPGSAVGGDGEEIDLVLELLDLDGALWTPSITAAADAGPEVGIVLAEKAARDLGVDVGDEVRVVHPERTAAGFSIVSSSLVVGGTHPNPIRNFAFLDRSFADEFGLGDVANALQVVPAAGFDRSDVQRAAFATEGVASAQPAARIGEAFDEALEQFVGILVIMAGAVLVLALLIAFNSARIGVEERRREHATMLAFGVRVRSVLGTITVEAVIVGLLATAVGIVAGMGVLGWMLDSLARRTLPDFEITPAVSPASIAIAVVVGVLSVSLAPLLLVRRIRRMDLPDTLRVME